MRVVVVAAIGLLCLAVGAAVAADRPLGPADANAGKTPYLQECSGCHGERGDGAGPAAAFLDPRPRDFTKRLFKLRTTPTGQPPATADVLRVIERGIPGTAMPSFGFLAPEERRTIAGYVLRLAGLLDEPEPARLEVGTPPPGSPATVEAGRQLFTDAGCVSCHGPLGRGDGTQEMKDTEGRPIRPRDFTAGVFRGGGERVDLYHRIVGGMDGSPMPAYGDVLDPAQRWALVDYVLSLRAPSPPPPLPADPVAAGRAVAEKYYCRGCHVLDDGKGGDVGPDLRISGQKLDPTWTRKFLRDPRAHGKIYPWRVARMPKLPLSEAEVDVLARWVAAMGRRPDRPLTVPDVASFPAERVDTGKLFFLLRCTECHNLGNVIEIPAVKRQGPDLIHVKSRVDYDWARNWITDPKKIDPNTKMVVPGGLGPADVDAVRMFLWKTSVEANSK
jgi:mono/diheme cytochrome c family protein